MCRALDYCDAMAPGIHIGSSLVPAALAAAEAVGGCSGADFMAALAAGAEISSRLNLSEAMYDGFDPTGIAVVFAPTAAAARILKLTPQQTLHALALAFNRCGGSFQSNIDGSLAVRAIQGWVAETGVVCAQMAQRGFTGPVHFLGGLYGYGYLYGRGELDVHALADGLGSEWRLLRMMFKKYPSCGATQGMTELVLQLVAELDLRPEQVRAVRVVLPPYSFKLVGQAWRIGANPRVDAQFSAQYCVANAIVRRGSALPHFRVEAVRDAAVGRLIERITVEPDPALNARGHTAVDVRAAHRRRAHARALARHRAGLPRRPAQRRAAARALRRLHGLCAAAAGGGSAASVLPAGGRADSRAARCAPAEHRCSLPRWEAS